MYDPNSIPRRSATRLLMSPFALLYAALPGYAAHEADTQEKAEAAKVAKKLEKANKKKLNEAKEEREALSDFEEEVLEYAALHKNEQMRLGNPELAAVQAKLAAAIVRKRAKARQGDIFVREVQPIFKRLILEQLKGPDTQAAQKAVVEGNPGHDEDDAVSAPIVVKINAVYPRGAARSTVPPSVLAVLPVLPACLHYRFVDRDLILVDTVTQVIVDFLPTAAPELIR